MKRLLVAALLFAICLTGLGFTESYAAGMITTTEMDHIPFSSVNYEESIPPLSPAADYSKSRSSQALIDFIKEKEGFAAEPYWDYHQWTVGYGVCCRNNKGEPCVRESDRAEIAERYLHPTREEAEQMLREEIAREYEGYVIQYEKRHDLSFTQNEFDALVSFTYNLGPSWTFGGYKINAYLENPNPNKADVDLVRAMGSWCRAGGEVNTGLTSRRLRESMIFLYGDYKGNDSSHPDYHYVVYNGNGSLLSGSYSDAVDYFQAGKPYGSLLHPVWDSEDGAAVTDASLENHSDARSFLPFTDVPEGKWYYDSVLAVYESGLMKGITDTTFVPEGYLTRGQLVTILYRMAKSPEVSGNSGFEDVKSGRYYSDAIAWAKENGIVNGATDTTFSPEGRITREQIASIFFRYYTKYLGNKADGRADLGLFADGSNVSKYAKEPISWAIHENLMRGISNPGEPVMLKPKSPCTRAQAAEFIVRLTELLENGFISTGAPSFAGWFNSDGEQICNDTIVEENQVVTAQWITR